VPGTSSLKMFGKCNCSRILSDQFTFLVVRSYEQDKEEMHELKLQVF